MTDIEKKIIRIIKDNSGISSSAIFEKTTNEIALRSLKRMLTKLVNQEILIKKGVMKSTRYYISPSFDLFIPIEIDDYFLEEVDQRIAMDSFNFSLISTSIGDVGIFSHNELNRLEILQEKFQKKVAELSPSLYAKELERLAIDLSWKSSQIEGNTYSLLETEQLLKENKETIGKSKEEAQMLLNHKEALDYVIENPTYITPLNISKIESIHSLLIKNLGVERNIRKGLVRITGTNYKPLDNEFQIREALQEMCELINKRSNVFEKAFLLLVLLSYIQPFEDGNKRTARIVSNAILINNHFCPLSFRTINPIEYKKAMLLFYEQNNITVFKEIFISQYDFAVNQYF